MKQIKATNVSLREILAALVSGLPLHFYILLPFKTNYKEQEQISLQKNIFFLFISYFDYISNFDSREQKKPKTYLTFSFCPREMKRDQMSR